MALQESYKAPWLTFPQFKPATGRNYEADKSFDLFAFHPHASSGYARHVIEIKIHRDDYTKEMRDPSKRRMGLRWATHFWFAVPELLVKKEEVPPECGLIEVRKNSMGIYECKATLPAPELAGTLPTWSFLGAFLRRYERERNNEPDTDQDD